jgi:hypothetical protein
MTEQKQYQVKKCKNYFTIITPEGKELDFHGPSGAPTAEEIASLIVEEMNLIGAKDENQSIIYQSYSYFDSFCWNHHFYQDLCDFSSDIFTREDYRLLLRLTASDILIIRTLYMEFDEKVELDAITNWVLGLDESKNSIKEAAEIDKVWEKRLDLIKSFLPYFREESKKMTTREVDHRFVSYSVRHPFNTSSGDEKPADSGHPNLSDQGLKDQKFNNCELVFNDEDFLLAREHSVSLCLKLKNDFYTYKGIELILNYQRRNSKGVWVDKKHKILTGKRMGTAKILPSLNQEVLLLLNMGLVFPIDYVTNTNMEDLTFRVRLYPNSLYYFTVLV